MTFLYLIFLRTVFYIISNTFLWERWKSYQELTFFQHHYVYIIPPPLLLRILRNTWDVRIFLKNYSEFLKILLGQQNSGQPFDEFSIRPSPPPFSVYVVQVWLQSKKKEFSKERVQIEILHVGGGQDWRGKLEKTRGNKYSWQECDFILSLTLLVSHPSLFLSLLLSLLSLSLSLPLSLTHTHFSYPHDAIPRFLGHECILGGISYVF